MDTLFHLYESISKGAALCVPSSYSACVCRAPAAQAVFNGRPIAKHKLKMGIQHNTYSLQQSTCIEDLFWVSGEA